MHTSTNIVDQGLRATKDILAWYISDSICSVGGEMDSAVVKNALSYGNVWP